MTKEEENKLAESYGFSCIKDDKRGHGWCKFGKDNLLVWRTNVCWVSATVAFGFYCNHRHHKTLEEALSRGVEYSARIDWHDELVKEQHHI
jgi:hypothetical protein